jgi:hypothetical protein
MAYIKGKQLADGTIVNAKIKDATIEAGKLAGSIPSGKLDLTGAFDFSGSTGVSVPTPTLAAHAATKGYVDSVKQALDIKESVRAATAGNNLGANYANGVLTATANGALSIDGLNDFSQGERVLVKDQTTGSQNGIYVVTTVGDAGNPFVLTRASDFDTDAEVTPGAFCFIEEGTVNSDSGFVLATDAPITLDTTALSFTQFSGAGSFVAGDGIAKAGNTISINLDADSGLSVGANGLKIDASVLADGAIAVAADELVFIDADGGTKRESVADFSSAIAGNGLSSAAGALNVAVVAAGGVEINNDELQVKKADSSLSSDANGLKVNLNAEGSIAIKGAAGLAAPVMTSADLGQTPGAVAADDTDTTINITSTPAADGAVRVFVNGVAAELGDGVKTKDCYFTNDAGVTARAIADIAAGDDLYWNGLSAYALDNTDVIDIVYAKIN